MSDILNDPEMKEIIDDFCLESRDLLRQIEEALEAYEEDLNRYDKLEEFGQIIDRIMGTAKNLDLDQLGIICELGKVIGYKASQSKEPRINTIVCGVLFDTCDLLNVVFDDLQDGTSKVKEFNVEAFITRLRWLSDKFKHIERGSVDVAKGEKVEENPGEMKMDQASIDALLNSLDL